MNKYTVNLPLPVIATNDANLITGTSGTRWVGTNPLPTGASGNFESGNGFIYSNEIVINKTDTALTKLVTISIPTLTVGQVNAIQIQLSALEFSPDIIIYGIVGIGVIDREAGATTVSAPLLLNDLNYSVVRNSMIIRIPESQIPNLQNKALNVMIYYR